MSRYRMIALDMDGTVLNEKQQISAENQAALLAAEEAGIKVVFATGRGVPKTLPYVQELGLKSPLVTVNGGEVWKAPGELFERHTLMPEQVIELRQIALKYDTWYWSYDLSGVHNRESWSSDIKPEERTWLKFGYYMENPEVLSVIRKHLEADGRYEITNSHPFNLELNPKGVSKASGLLRVCELIGCDMSQVIAMGDSLNDTAMIQAAGLGVAMGNAQEEVKRIADVVTVTNEEHGVAKIIRKYALV